LHPWERGKGKDGRKHLCVLFNARESEKRGRGEYEVDGIIGELPIKEG